MEPLARPCLARNASSQRPMMSTMALPMPTTSCSVRSMRGSPPGSADTIGAAIEGVQETPSRGPGQRASLEPRPEGIASDRRVRVDGERPAGSELRYLGLQDVHAVPVQQFGNPFGQALVDLHA